MMRRIARVAMMVAVVWLAAGCGKTGRPQVGMFAIYLTAGDVKTSDLAGEKWRTVPLRQPPLLTTTDIVAYSRATHEMQLTPAAYRRVRDLYGLPVRVDGVPFVVCVGARRVYAGAFVTPLSSASFDGVVITDTMDEQRPVIRIDLGYPGPDFFRGVDPRSDPAVMAALEAAGRLR